MKPSDIVLAIGQLTDQTSLDRIGDAVRDRKRVMAMVAAATIAVDIRVGDTVRFSTTIRPTYLVGLTAKVTGLNRQSVRIECPDDPRYGRFRGSKAVRLPHSLIAYKVTPQEGVI